MKIKEVLAAHGCEPPRLGIECGDGWADIIDRLITDLVALGWNRDVVQIKEKFGGLRFYISSDSGGLHKRIAKAEEESFETCEVCGEIGGPTATAWVKIRCEEHVDA
jgi:hypothetical protein